MTKLIFLKSLRSIWRNKKPYFSGIFVLAAGLSAFIGLRSTSTVFNRTINRYHYETNYSDAIAQVVAMPKSKVTNLARIDGVSDCLGVLEYNVDARIDGFDGFVKVQLVGVGDEYGRTINIYKHSGEPLRSDNDIWLGSSFFGAHGFNVGDTIRLLINGNYEVFTIRGSVMSPEFLLVSLDGLTLADGITSTFGFVRNSAVEHIAGMPGMVNNINIKLDDGRSFIDVRPLLEDVLNPYGTLSLISRAEHPNNMAIAGESNTVGIMATAITTLFLSISCAMIYVALKRLIEMERTEIGTLKAIGFSSKSIIFGYFIQGVLSAVIGSVLSIAPGWVIGNAYYGMLMNSYNVKPIPFAIDIQACVYGSLIALVVCLLAVIMGAKEAIRIQPAEAMRAAYPKLNSLNIKLDSMFLRVLFNIRGRYAIRSMLRNSRRTLATVTGIALTFALINFLFSFRHHIDEISYDHYNKILLADAVAILVNPVPRSTVLSETNHIPGVVEAEANLNIQVELEYMGIKKELGLLGLERDASLFNITDFDGNRHWVDKGIILNRFYADALGVSEGQTVTLHSPYLQKAVQVDISRVIEESFGNGAYMEISELSKLFGNGVISNAVFITIDDNLSNEVQTSLVEAPNVSWYIDYRYAMESMREGFQGTISIINIIIAVSILICFAVVYNTSSISLGEKKREYATLRIFGYHVSDVSEINNIEYALMLFVGSIIGTVIAFFASPPLSALFNNESSMLNATITPQSTLLAFACCAMAVVLSCALIRSQIKKLVLANEMKVRE